MKYSILARRFTLLAYAGLILVIIGWYGVADPAPLPLVALLVPLLFPLPGLIRGKPYTYAWTSFLILIYFIHGVVEAYASPATRLWSSTEILLSVVVYTGAVLYARLRGRELKMSRSSATESRP